MEIYQLRTFVTVAQQGHLTQAAEVLHLSQPAVTAQIKAIEEEVGMPLFERTAGGVVLTLAGQELLPQAQDILAAARQLYLDPGYLACRGAGGPYCRALSPAGGVFASGRHGRRAQCCTQKRAGWRFLPGQEPLCQRTHRIA